MIEFSLEVQRKRLLEISEVKFSPLERLQHRCDLCSPDIQVDFGRNFSEFISSGETNYLHYGSFGCCANGLAAGLNEARTKWSKGRREN